MGEMKLHTTIDLPSGSIQSLEIEDGTIATADIADGAVTAAKLASACKYKVILTDVKAGEITADDADRFVTVSPVTGTITNVGLYVAECGTDSTDPLYIEADVKIGGTSCLTTKPKIDKTSGSDDAVETLSAAPTGGAQAVIDTDHDDVAVGDVITVTMDVTRTTPDTEITGAAVIIEISEKVGS